MASSYFKATKDIHDVVVDLIRNYHTDLIEDTTEVAVMFREKATKSAPYGTARRVTPLIDALLADEGIEYKWILEVPQDCWVELDSRQQRALLDALLCACRADFDDKTGDLKRYIAKPDIMAFQENLERFGNWYPKSESEDDEELGPDDGEDITVLLAAGE